MGEATFEDENKNYTLTLVLNCNKSAGYTLLSTEYNDGDMRMNIDTRYSCSLGSFDVIRDVLYSGRYVFLCIGVVIGLALCFFGLKLHKVTAFLIGFIVFFVVGAFIGGAIMLTDDFDDMEVYLFIIIATVIGILGGVLLGVVEKLVTFFAGFGAGICGMVAL